MSAETRNPYAGPLTEADFAALAHSTKEPGPQQSKASERSWCAVDALLYVCAAVYVLGLLARVW